MRIFISYGAAADQATALRLQALAAVNGLDVSVPPVAGRRQNPPSFTAIDAARVVDADVVLGVVAAGFSEICRFELNTALQHQRPTIVMAELSFASKLQPFLGENLVVIDPNNPGAAELRIVEHLKSIDAAQSQKQALLALGTIALGLLIFAPQD